MKFIIGEEVRVVTGPRKGHIGIVVDINETFGYIHVLVDNGKRSYAPQSIEKTGGFYMKLQDYKKVAVIEMNNQPYHFALYDTVYPGDSVLVSGVSAGKILVVKEVITAEEAAKRFSKDILEEVICRVNYDSSSYIKRRETRKRIAELKQKIEERIAEINKTRKYEVYANADEEIRILYEEYKKIIEEQGE